MAWNPLPMLRPLGVGERLDAAFKIYGRNFLAMAKAVFIVSIPAGIIDLLISLSTTAPVRATGAFATTTTASASTRLGGDLATFLITIVVSSIVTATVYRIIVGSYLGQRPTWRAGLTFGIKRFRSVLWITFLMYMALGVPLVGLVIAIVILAALHLTVAAVVTGLLLGVGYLVFAVWFAAFAYLGNAYLLLEDVRGFKALRRAHTLVKGHWWSVFGTEILGGLIIVVGEIIVGIVFAVALLAAVASGNLTVADVLRAVTQIISSTVFLPFTSSIAVILAIDMKVRKEGFDIQLLAANLGTSPSPDALSFLRPYGPPAGYPGAGPYGSGQGVWPSTWTNVAPPPYQPWRGPAGYGPPPTGPMPWSQPQGSEQQWSQYQPPPGWQQPEAQQVPQPEPPSPPQAPPPPE